MLKIKEDHRHMFTYDTKNLIREGDIALVYENMFLTKQIKIKRGEKY